MSLIFGNSVQKYSFSVKKPNILPIIRVFFAGCLLVSRFFSTFVAIINEETLK